MDKLSEKLIQVFLINQHSYPFSPPTLFIFLTINKIPTTFENGLFKLNISEINARKLYTDLEITLNEKLKQEGLEQKF